MSRQEKLAALASTGVTKAELDNIDGGTARGTTAIADGDGVLINDAGTMRMTSVETMATYIGTKVGGGLEFIASTDISNAATTSFTGFDASKYDSYLFTFHAIESANDGVVLYAKTSSDTSSHSYDGGSGNYVGEQVFQSDNSNTTSYLSYSTFAALTSATKPLGTDSPEPSTLNGTVEIFSSHLSKYTLLENNFAYISQNDQHTRASSSIWRAENAQVNAIQFYMSAGNITSGTITMYGMVNS